MKSELNYACKRALDIMLAGVALLVLFLPLCALLLLQLVFLGWPPVFRRARPGKNGKIFHLIKLRSMSNQAEADGQLLSDAERLTSWGRFLRSSSLDELPELWNVLRGEMSLVGPRPLLVEYLPLYSKEQSRRHLVRPGITGWAQVNGRNALSWEKKFELDVWYVDNWSLLLDFKIMLLTLRALIRRDGIQGQGVATMTKFLGNVESDKVDK